MNDKNQAMKPSVFFYLMLIAPSLAKAQSCIELAVDKDRLTCFDDTADCMSLESASARLGCFDKAYSSSDSVSSPDEEVREVPVEVVDRAAASQTKAKLNMQVKAKKEVSEHVSVSTQAPDDFGKRKSPKAPIGYIEATIVDVMRNSRRIDYIHLDNGQIWRESEDNRVRFKIGQDVRIEKGALNSFNLRIKGVRKLIKVRRMN